MNEEASYYDETQNTPCHQQQNRRVVDFDRKCLSKQHFLIHIDEWTRHTSCRRLWPLATQSTRLETSDNMLSAAPLNTSTSNFMAAARHEMCRQLEIIGSRVTFIQPEKEVKKQKEKNRQDIIYKYFKKEIKSKRRNPGVCVTCSNRTENENVCRR